jgi:hypothetical protein
MMMMMRHELASSWLIIPSYSPVLASCDFFYLSTIRNSLKGQNFADIPDMQCNLTSLRRFRQWHHRLTTSTAYKATSAPHAQVFKFAFTWSFRKLNCLTMYIFLQGEKPSSKLVNAEETKYRQIKGLDHMKKKCLLQIFKPESLIM